MYINWATLDLLSIDGITIPHYTFDCPHPSKRFSMDKSLNLSNNESDMSDELSLKYADAMKAVDGE